MTRLPVNLLKKISLLVFLFLTTFVVYINLPFVFRETTACIYIHPHEKFNQFISDLVNKTRHVSPLVLKIYARFSHLDRHLEAGEYCFNEHASIVDIIRKIGRADREIRKFTIVDGWTYEQMIEHLRAAPTLSNISLLDNKHELSAKLQVTDINLEGLFYPDTYYYTYPDSALDILQQAHALMQQRIEALYQESKSHTFYKTSYELLIAASIIQKEASDPAEQMLVAGVMANRIKQRMKLQMDPTVIYALYANHAAPLTKQDLKKDSPYNTYLHFGLPPTPICMPGETALYAAAHPKESAYLYYVSKKNHTHQFSKTLKEQTEAIKKYLLEGKNDK